MKEGLSIRSRLLESEGCGFEAEITADYGNELYVFSTECRGDKNGAVTFRIMEPETLSGITGSVSDRGGKLTFGDTALGFPLLTDDQLSPVSAPWILLKTLRSGYLTSACFEDDQLHLTFNDTYEEDALQVDIWTDGNKQPVRADILYDGMRILSLEIKKFALL